ncbi:hypothetical protein AVEN_238725-1 [Araneus ventricosus]|uniref:Uncharacterized protein n=1 Tax=Araneus ventricosus TaxID=182803 RepID=A0A4Y2GFY3_ARAVE|nr:hypothetical protein AVEN_238725-1 [Araneus ventricosus]
MSLIHIKSDIVGQTSPHCYAFGVRTPSFAPCFSSDYSSHSTLCIIQKLVTCGLLGSELLTVMWLAAVDFPGFPLKETKMSTIFSRKFSRMLLLHILEIR